MAAAASEPLRRVGPGDRDAAGHVSLASLIGFADEACRRLLGEDVRTVDCKTLFLKTAPATSLAVTAREIHRTAGQMVWQIRIAIPEGETMAIVVQVFDSVADASPGLAQPAESDDALSDGSLRQRRRDNLLVAATGVIAEKGFASATIREIARAAGVHVPTVYQYFASKEDILEMVYRNELDRAIAAVRLGTDPTRPAREQLALLISNHIGLSNARRQEVGILNREFKHLGPAARREMIVMYRRLLAPFEEVLRRGMEGGEFRDLDPFIAANFMDVAGDIWSLRQFFFDGEDLDRFRRVVIDFLIGAVVLPARGAAPDDVS